MPSPTSHPLRWPILGVLCLSLFLAVVDNTIVNVALPTMSRQLAASTSQLQWIVDAYALVFAGLLLAGGSLGDRFGRKGALQLGLAWFGLCSVAAAFATSAGQLIAARAAMGAGAALIFPATLAILSHVFVEPAERAKAIGLWSAVVGLAVALGPITGGALLKHFWWGSIFWVNIPVVIVALALGAWLIPASRDEAAPRIDLGGVLLSIGAIGLAVYTTIEAPHQGWLSARTLFGYAISGLLIAAMIAWELRHAAPMLDVRLFSNVRFSAASLSITVGFFALFGFIFLVTQYFQFVKGYDTLSAGVHTLPFAIVIGIAAPVSTLLVRRFGARTIIPIGLLTMSVGFVIASTMDETTAYFGATILSMCLIAGGLGIVTAPSTDTIVGALPPEKAGVGSAVNDVTRELGGTLGVAVIGSVFASLYGSRLAERLASLPVSAEALAAARSSVAAAFGVAQRSGPAQSEFETAARQAFSDGLRAGSLVAAGVVGVGALVARRLLAPRPQPAAAAADSPVIGAPPAKQYV